MLRFEIVYFFLFSICFQEAFTCVRTDEMNSDCNESEKFYELNRILGLKEDTSTDEVTSNELSPIENNKSHSNDRIGAFQNIEKNQRYKPFINNSNRIAAQTATIRNQIAKKTTAIPYISTVNTEKIAQTTNVRELSMDKSESTIANELFPSTTFPPVNIAQFFDLTTRKSFNPQTITFRDNTEYTTDVTSTGSANDFTTTNTYESNTRFIPDLIEEYSKTADRTQTDEIVESIKQLQKFYPQNVDESREKRFLFKADSVKNRQKLFNMLNHH